MIEFSSGDRFGPYVIEDMIGRGGMGVLYKAREARLGRHVALKLIAPELLDDDAFAARFVREARLCASIDHPNVIPIFDVGEAAGRMFISMRYVPGTDLRRVLAAEAPLAPARVTHVVGGAAAALDAAHDLGLVHRDVKPGNVLLAAPDEHVYLTDFGLAKPILSDSIHTQTGRLMGTVDYVAPEQIEGGEADARADVYSLGCVLFHALTGQVPYEGSEVRKLWQHTHAEPPAPGELDSHLSPFDPVVARAMAKDPEDRHGSAGELASELQDVGSGAAVTVGSAISRKAVRPERKRKPGRGERPRRLLLALAGGVAALLLAAGVAIVASDDEPTEATSAAEYTAHERGGFASRPPPDWRTVGSSGDQFGFTVNYASPEGELIRVRGGTARFTGGRFSNRRPAPEVNSSAIRGEAEQYEFTGGECAASKCLNLYFAVLDGDEYEVWGPLSAAAEIRLVARELIDFPDFESLPVERCTGPRGSSVRFEIVCTSQPRPGWQDRGG